ncbi:unnamed protein product [Paramecium primaurelia]|uniref:Transmembrane protein n=1 Tax=Paramecium primaurelia TaxID=5886 RepID=A0A8S1M4Z5_PARPR|nr:unnamed protein product [Paramecium primaurelia]
MPNLIIEKQTPENLNTKWEADNINANALDEQINRIQFIENPKINAGWQVLRQNQISRTQSIQVTQDFKDLITQKNIYSQETDQTIINEAKLTINQITKSLLLDEKIGKLTCFIKLHNYYEDLIKLTQYQKCVQSFISLLNLSFQIVIIVYLTGDYDLFMSALIFLNVINPALQLISFLVFQFQTFRDQEIVRKFVNAFLFGLFNYFNIWESILLIFYKTQNPLLLGIQRDFSSDTYIKFKSYALKFRGTLAVSVFQYPKANIDDTIQEIKKQPFFQAIMWRASVEEALNKIPQFFIFILALTQNDVTALWVLSFLMQLKESIFALKDILELVIKAFFIPALNLSTDSVDQFFQSILYFRSISNSILLEYPKSFQIISKASEEYLTKQCTFKINVKNLDFSYYVGKKKEKMLAQFRYVLALIRTNLEIDQAQKLFYMGPEIKDFIRCLQVSRMQQLKLNFYLDEMNASDFHYINALVQKCPSNLKVLQIQIEATEQKQMELMLKRQSNLKAFSYSFFQKIYNYRNHQQIYQLKLLIIDNQFFKLDKYTFEGLNFEIAGNLDLKNCSTFFANFCSLRFFKLTLINNNTFQEFNFLNNIKSNLENLDVTFEKIIINFQSFQFNNLKKLKMILKNCEFDKGVLYNNLININSDIRKYIYIDMRLCKNKFDKKEKTDLVKRLEMKLFDATILI